MDILDDMGVSKLSAIFFFKVAFQLCQWTKSFISRASRHVYY